ncbi:MAG: Ig-like domain-containing protein [Pirellulales bacterium]
MIRRFWQFGKKPRQFAKKPGRWNGRRLNIVSAVEWLEDRRLLAGLAAPTTAADFYTVAAGGTLSVTAAQGVLANDSDADNDPLTAALAVGPLHGDVTLNSDGSFTYTPLSGYTGDDSFYYTANDGTEDSSVTQVTLTVVDANEPPIAQSDAYTTTVNAPLTINSASGVLANDSDADSDALTATLVASPSHGTVTLNADGSFVYTPTSDFVGVDSFNYLANDGQADSSVVSVQITVDPGNFAPVANADDYSTTVDTPLVIAAPGVLANDTDADNNPLIAVVVDLPQHGDLTFNADGSFTYTPDSSFTGADQFTYKATDGDADSAVATVSLSVNSINSAPVAVNDAYTTTTNVTLEIFAPGVLANDMDADSDPLTAVVVSQPTHGTLTFNSNGSFTYVPATDYTGADSFSYKANDGDADSVVATVALTVNAVNSAPTATNDAYAVTKNVTLEIAAPGVLANDSDADSDALTAVVVSQPTHGTLTLNANGSFTFVPTTDYTGADSFTYKANDGDADSAVATVSLTIQAANSAPTAAGDSYTTTKNTPLAIAAPGVLSNDSDADNDSLQAFLLTGPTNGAVVLNPDGSFTYTPATDYTGPDSFTYVASDGALSSDVTTVTLSVNAPNTAPVAAPDAYAAFSDTPLTINAATGVLANDTDANGDPLTAVLSISPTHGTLTLNSDGSFTYTPAAGYVGADSFSYVANDGAAISNLVQVSLTVTLSNVAPVGVADSYSVASGGSLNISSLAGVLANDTDANGDELTALEISGPSHGTLTLNANGSFTYQSTAGYSGVDTFTYQASDGTLNSATTTVTINVSSNAPVASADSYTVAENGTLTRTAANGVLANDTDVDGNSLTASVVTQPQHGTLSLQADGSFTYTPAANYFGPDSFTYVASDGTTNSNIATVSITVTAVNSTPVAVADSYSVTTGQTLTTTASNGVLLNDTDADGDSLSATLFSLTTNGTLSLNANGSFTYTPNSGFTGVDSFSYRATDGTASSNTATVTITVNAASSTNTAPVGVADSYSTTSGQTLTTTTTNGVLANDTDADGNTLTATLVATTTNGTLNLSSNGAFTYTPNSGFTGTDSFTYVANDGTANSAATTVAITVAAASSSTATAVSASGPATGIRGQELTFTLVATGSTSTQESFAIDWNNDGTVDQTVTGPASGTQVARAFDATGAVTFKVSLPNTTLSTTKTVTLSSVQKSGSTVTVGGTAGNDVITVDPYRGNGVMIKLNGAVVGQYRGVSLVIVHGGDGNDTITAGKWLMARTLFYGGTGNDRLTGGFADSILVGGDGDDVLTGRYGDDVLIGGAGKDSLNGGYGFNLQMGGSTDYDANDAALLSLMNTWTRPATLSKRISRVNASSTPLASSAVTPSDAAVDSIVSKYAFDWILASSSDNDAVSTKGKLARVSRLT